MLVLTFETTDGFEMIAVSRDRIVLVNRAVVWCSLYAPDADALKLVDQDSIESGALTMDEIRITEVEEL